MKNTQKLISSIVINAKEMEHEKARVHDGMKKAMEELLDQSIDESIVKFINNNANSGHNLSYFVKSLEKYNSKKYESDFKAEVYFPKSGFAKEFYQSQLETILSNWVNNRLEIFKGFINDMKPSDLSEGLNTELKNNAHNNSGKIIELGAGHLKVNRCEFDKDLPKSAFDIIVHPKEFKVKLSISMEMSASLLLTAIQKLIQEDKIDNKTSFDLSKQSTNEESVEEELDSVNEEKEDFSSLMKLFKNSKLNNQHQAKILSQYKRMKIKNKFLG